MEYTLKCLQLSLILLLLFRNETVRAAVTLRKKPVLSSLKSNLGRRLPTFNKFISGCEDAEKSGIYVTNIAPIQRNLTVRCDVDFFGGNWTVLQRRGEGEMDFRRSFQEYKDGFGDQAEEFWFGLDKVHFMTIGDRYELFFLLENGNGIRGYAMYDRFTIANSKNNFMLRTLGVYVGEAGNAMQYHLNMPFSTYDRKNNAKRKGNCSKLFWGGWWYNDCYMSNPNGKYPAKSEMHKKCFRCMTWVTFTQDCPLEFVQIMIRPYVEDNWAHSDPD